MASGYFGKDGGLHSSAGHPSGQHSGVGDPATAVAADRAVSKVHLAHAFRDKDGGLPTLRDHIAWRDLPAHSLTIPRAKAMYINHLVCLSFYLL